MNRFRCFQIAAPVFAGLMCASATAQYGYGSYQESDSLAVVQALQNQQNELFAQMMQSQIQPLQAVNRRPGECTAFPTERIDFGYFTIEVPQGWTADAQAGNISSMAHLVRATSPDNRFQIAYAAEWYSLFDNQTGGYLPGNQVMERYILPDYQQTIAPYQIESIVARSQNTRSFDPTGQAMGVAMPRDAGTIQFAVRTPQGEQLWGEGYAETLRSFEDTMGTGNGAFSVPLASIVVAPGNEASLSQARGALQYMRNSIRLDGSASQAWLQGAQQARGSVAQGNRQRSQMITQYGEDVSQMRQQSWQYYNSSSDRINQLTTNAIRGGEYMTDPTTGQQYWTPNDVNNWWVNPGGDVVGTELQQVPTYDQPWQPLQPQYPQYPGNGGY